MCDLKIYKPGDQVNMKSGGVLFKGSLEIKFQDLLDEDKQDENKDKLDPSVEKKKIQSRELTPGRKREAS